MKRAIQVLVLLAVLAMLLGLGWLLTQKNSPLYQPIQNYELVSPTQQVTSDEINVAIAPHLGNSFWDIPLDDIQADLRRLDWVLKAEVKRKWPDLLYVSVTEQTPVARWGDNGLVNRMGQVFFPGDLSGFENLVRLRGSLDDSALVLQRFIKLQQQLDSLKLTVAELDLSENDVWRIKVLNGPEIVVDSTDYELKVDRFKRAYPQIEPELRNSARIYDLRYSNGFIVANH